MTITINDLLQTIKHRLNRSMVQKPNVEQINAVIDKFVNGGRVLEDEELDLLLNPPTDDILPTEVLDAAFFDAGAELAADALTPDLDDILESQGAAMLALADDAKLPEITEPNPEVEAALQQMVDDAQEMGLYDMKYDVPPSPSIATPLTMDELVEVAELQKELAQQSGLATFGNALTGYKEATDASKIFDPAGIPGSEDVGNVEVAAEVSEASETVVANDSAVADVSGAPQNTNEEAS